MNAKKNRTARLVGTALALALFVALLVLASRFGTHGGNTETTGRPYAERRAELLATPFLDPSAGEDTGSPLWTIDRVTHSIAGFAVTELGDVRLAVDGLDQPTRQRSPITLRQSDIDVWKSLSMRPPSAGSWPFETRSDRNGTQMKWGPIEVLAHDGALVLQGGTVVRMGDGPRVLFFDRDGVLTDRVDLGSVR